MTEDSLSIIIPTLNRKEDLTECVESILKSSCENFELIVVDNASTDGTESEFKKIFGGNESIKFIRSKKNLGAGGGRNRGAEAASGKYLLFIDSDNVVDADMIRYLIEFIESHPDCGMVGPLMLFKDDPSLIWTYFADINMWSSRASYRGYGEKDRGQYRELEKVGHIPNCFMVRREDFEKAGGFDEKYLVMFEEADFSEKIKKLGKKLYILTKAKIYHNAPLPEKETQGGFTFKDERVAYLTSRNRIYFMKKNAGILQLFIFFLLFFPLSLFYYQLSLARRREFRKARACLKGSFDGLVM